ncbi:hypothetical protein [Sphingomonas sp. ERG5]|uniref:hypothetical protein n=1 Tax=Sphingomonas sp. ERG5 TaxID=1381597 RepID=UPI00054B322D|nr:hypothetical protein [Sphingomonas sp. ERG5]
MADEEPSDQDLGAPEATGGDAAPMPKGRRSLSRMRREMTDEELSNSGVQKIMMDDVDRLEGEKAHLETFVERFHKADKENAVLKEKAKVRIASDISFGTFLTIGAAAVGYSPVVEKVPNASSILVAIGIFLMAGGLASKVVLK